MFPANAARTLPFLSYVFWGHLSAISTATASTTKLRMTWRVSAFAPAAVGLPRGGRASMSLFLRKTPTNEANNLETGVDTSAENATQKVLRITVLSPCVRCLTFLISLTLFCWHTCASARVFWSKCSDPLLFSQGSAAPTLLFLWAGQCSFSQLFGATGQ